jgi:hypothetical protein
MLRSRVPQFQLRWNSAVRLRILPVMTLNTTFSFEHRQSDTPFAV